MSVVYLIGFYIAGLLTLPALGGVVLYRRKRRFERRMADVK